MAPLTTLAPAIESIEKTKTKYSLDISSGVAGFFGGDAAVSAMGTVPYDRGRRWLGWYNTPGSYEISRRYGVIRSRIWDDHSPGVNVDPVHLFLPDGREGPPYCGVFSKDNMAATGHFACLLMDECEDLSVPDKSSSSVGEESQPYSITVTTLSRCHDSTTTPTPSGGTEWHTTTHPLTLGTSVATYLSAIPISATVTSAVMCILVADDWYSSALILYGAIASGICYLVIGSGKLELQHPNPAPGAPPGDGILDARGNDVVLLLGREEAVNIITRGKFSLTFRGGHRYNLISFCAVLLKAQFIAQLLIIPVGTLFGQVMFIASLFASWTYTTFLSTIDLNSLQRDIVKSVLRMEHRKYRFRTRTTMAVYILLRLKSQSNATSAIIEGALDELLPNDTDDWKSWKKNLLLRLMSDSWDKGLTGLTSAGSPLIGELSRDANVAIGFFKEESTSFWQSPMSGT